MCVCVCVCVCVCARVCVCVCVYVCVCVCVCVCPRQILSEVHGRLVKTAGREWDPLRAHQQHAGCVLWPAGRAFIFLSLSYIIWQYPLLTLMVHGPQMVCVCARAHACVCEMNFKWALLWHMPHISYSVLCQCTHTHACTHACTHARTHARTHTHTHTSSYHLSTANQWG